MVTFPTPAPTFKLCRLASLKGNTITQGRVVIFNEITLDPHTPNNNPKVTTSPYNILTLPSKHVMRIQMYQVEVDILI